MEDKLRRRWREVGQGEGEVFETFGRVCGLVCDHRRLYCAISAKEDKFKSDCVKVFDLFTKELETVLHLPYEYFCLGLSDTMLIIDEGQTLSFHSLADFSLVHRHSSPLLISSFATSSSALVVETEDGAVTNLWDRASGWNREGHLLAAPHLSEDINCLSIEDCVLAIAYETSIKVINIEEAGKPRAVLPSGADAVLLVSPFLLAKATEGAGVSVLLVWHLASQEVIRKVQVGRSRLGGLQTNGVQVVLVEEWLPGERREERSVCVLELEPLVSREVAEERLWRGDKKLRDQEGRPLVDATVVVNKTCMVVEMFGKVYIHYLWSGY